LIAENEHRADGVHVIVARLIGEYLLIFRLFLTEIALQINGNFSAFKSYYSILYNFITMDTEVNEGFLTALFGDNEIVSGQLPTTYSGAENITDSIKTLVLAAPSIDEATEADQLNKILAACKLPEGSFVMIKESVLWTSFRAFEHINNVLLFGITEHHLGISITLPENQVANFDGRKWVKTQPLSRLLHDGASKNALWQQALKPLFVG